MEGRIFPIQSLQFVIISLLSHLLRFLCFLNEERRVENFLVRVFKVQDLNVDCETFRVFIVVEYYFCKY